MERHRILFTAMLAAILVLTVTGPARAQDAVQIDRVPAWIDPTSRNSLSSAWGDLDNDGDLDMVVGTLEQGISVWTNMDGAFPRSVDIGEDRYPNPNVLHIYDDIGELADLGNAAVAIGDLNGDGLLDLVVASGRPDFWASKQPNQIFLNHTQPGGPISLQYAPVAWNNWPVEIGDDAPTSDVALADINGDGMLDIAFADRGWLRVYLNATKPGADAIAMNMMGAPDACPAEPLLFKVFDYVKLDEFSATELVDQLETMTIIEASAAARRLYDFTPGNGLDSNTTVKQALGGFEEREQREEVHTIIDNYLVGGTVDSDAAALAMNLSDFVSKMEAVSLIDALGGIGDTLLTWRDDGQLDEAAGSELIGRLPDDEAALLMELYEIFAPHLLYNGPLTSQPPDSQSPVSQPADNQLFVDAHYIDFGHLNNDGLPDLAAVVGNNTIRIWANDNGCYRAKGPPGAIQAASDTIYTTWWPSAIAWGDVNNDGFDELGITYDGGPNEVLGNSGGNLTGPIWFGAADEKSLGLDWGDVDGDGDLDLAVANTEPFVNAIYLNDFNQGYLNVLGFAPAWSDPLSYLVTGVKWGDIDNDGDLDLASTIYTAPDLVYRNLNPSMAIDAIPLLPEMTGVFTDDELAGFSANALAWGDVDNDGDLDLAVGYAIWNTPAEYAPAVHAPQNIYYDMMQAASSVVLENVEGELSPIPVWQAANSMTTTSVAWGDMDADGDLDLAVGDQHGTVDLYVNDDVDGLESDAVCTLNIRDSAIYDQLLKNKEVGLIASLRADPDLLAAVRADDDTLGRLVNQLIGKGADVDAALSEALTDSDLLAATYADRSLMDALWVDIFTRWIGSRAEAIIQAIAYPWTDRVLWYEKSTIDNAILTELFDDDDLANPLAPRLQESDIESLAGDGYVTDIAWGDVDQDGVLDLVVGVNDGINRLYLFDREGLDRKSPCPTLSEWLPVTDTSLDATKDVLQYGHRSNTYSVAFADVDNDGDLDLAVGNHTGGNEDDGNHDLLYLNRNGMLDNFPNQLIGATPRATRSLAWGDMDGDGDQDLAVGIWSGSRIVYENVDGFLLPDPVWESAETALTRSVAWGDADGDGDLDLAASSLTLFTGGAANDVYYNQGGILDSASAWPIGSASYANSNDVAWADMNGDGLLDLAVANQSAPIDLHLGQRPRPLTTLSADPRVVLYAEEGYGGITDDDASTLAPADFYALAQVRDSEVISITYRLVDPNQRPVRKIEAFYSLNGMDWQPAIPSSTTQVENLSAGSSTFDAEPHVFGWSLQDPSAKSRSFGWSDGVRFRIIAQPSLDTSPGDVSGSFQQGSVAAQSYPFRLADSQVQVFQKDDDGELVPAQGAIIYRLPSGQIEDATPLASDSGEIYRTNQDGILVGRGELATGDRLVAMLPTITTHAYTLYHTSARPKESGLAMPSVNISDSSVHTLTVSSENKLVLFDLDISLEWDEPDDSEFMANLDTAILRTSDLLFDLTDGQVALGNVRVFEDSENWVSADTVIYASNSIHPRASRGGVVESDMIAIITATVPITDASGVIIDVGQPFTNTFVPGQVRMGPFWDPFGQSEAELQQDWWRAYAHELAHYLLFLPDNYLGLSEGGAIEGKDCKGSFMTNAYDEDEYGEFLTERGWTDDCRSTVAQMRLTGRPDWDSITMFLDIDAPEQTIPGPTNMPLAVTTIDHVTPTTDDEQTLFTARNYDLRDGEGNLATLQQAQAYLFEMGFDLESRVRTAKRIIALGSTGNGRDRIKVRGANLGDRLCIFDGVDPALQGSGERTRMAGCVDRLRRSTQAIQVQPLSGWNPAITVTPVSSRTLAISVTQPLSSASLRVQVLPTYGDVGQSHIVDTPDLLMEPVGVTGPITSATVISSWQQLITVTHPTFEGFVRVYVQDDQEQAGFVGNVGPPRETLTQYFLSAGWGPPHRGESVNKRAWGPPHRGESVNRRVWGPPHRGESANARAWGANRRTMEAPVASGDGRVTIFNVDDLESDPGATALQSISNVPDLSPWLTQVGKAYRFAVRSPLTNTQESVGSLDIAFHYLQRDVPEGYEYALNVYHRPLQEGEWRRLHTELYVDENMVVATMPGPSSANREGIYLLAATVELPALQPGWNLFAYPVPEQRSVGSALASLRDQYSTVVAYDGAAENPWRTYDPDIANRVSGLEQVVQVNDLTSMDFGHSYLVYVTATTPITPNLAVAGLSPPAADPLAVSAPGDPLYASDTGQASVGEAPGLSGDLAFAPATIYGEVEATALGHSPAGSVIEAIIGSGENAVRCGEAIVQQQDEGICYYRMKVASGNQVQGCGVLGESVTLLLRASDGSSTSLVPRDSIIWNNTRSSRIDVSIP